MPHRRIAKRGSFSTHFDEIVQHFPKTSATEREAKRDPRDLQEKRDIHALLFERAWQIESGGDRDES